MGIGNIRRETIGIIFVFSPIILVHGYAEGPEVWNKWEDWLADDNLTSYTIKFKDQCGTVADHVRELEEYIDNEKVNMVVHSKGGLDARAYIEQNPGRVLNLIMIATPNEGTNAALMDLTPCSYQGSAGREDMLPGSDATKTPDQANTTYWAVAGDYPAPCIFSIDRPSCFIIPNDGFVLEESAKSHYMAFQTFPYNHSQLIQQKDVYDRVIPIVR